MSTPKKRKLASTTDDLNSDSDFKARSHDIRNLIRYLSEWLPDSQNTGRIVGEYVVPYRPTWNFSETDEKAIRQITSSSFSCVLSNELRLQYVGVGVQWCKPWPQCLHTPASWTINVLVRYPNTLSCDIVCGLLMPGCKPKYIRTPIDGDYFSGPHYEIAERNTGIPDFERFIATYPNTQRYQLIASTPITHTAQSRSADACGFVLRHDTLNVKNYRLLLSIRDDDGVLHCHTEETELGQTKKSFVELPLSIGTRRIQQMYPFLGLVGRQYIGPVEPSEFVVSME